MNCPIPDFEASFAALCSGPHGVTLGDACEAATLSDTFLAFAAPMSYRIDDRASSLVVVSRSVLRYDASALAKLGLPGKIPKTPVSEEQLLALVLEHELEVKPGAGSENWAVEKVQRARAGLDFQAVRQEFKQRIESALGSLGLQLQWSLSSRQSTYRLLLGVPTSNARALVDVLQVQIDPLSEHRVALNVAFEAYRGLNLIEVQRCILPRVRDLLAAAGFEVF